MTAIPEPVNSTLSKILAAYVKKYGDEPPRPHLGASLIGKPCDRRLWLTFRWADREQFDGRMLRLFQSGHLEEPRFIEDLRMIGVEVHDKDPEGSQWRVVALGGHFGGSMDGAGIGVPEAPKTWHVLEFKTASEKSFVKMKQDKVKKAKPEHYAQMQTYMGLTGMTRALYLMKNKNTDELHAERVEFDEKEFKRLMQRAEMIIKAPEPPPRIAKDGSWYECKYCIFHSLCWKQEAPMANCRTCVHSNPELTGDGRWSCAAHRKDISYDEQRKGCQKHRFIPVLLERFATPVGVDGDNVKYHIVDDPLKEFVNGEGPGAFSSQEIRDCEGKAALVDPNVREIRQTFGAKIEATENAPFVTVTKGMRGWFAVLMSWNHEGFYEPFQTSPSSFPDMVGAEKDAQAWAADEGVSFRPASDIERDRQPEPSRGAA